ncbi:Exodeoxyribonuclease VII small subunit [Seinonella peptonophila]|uniref:Exodeoxyribonuclease 7 small subunit n=1 Tax=Seinonella peptonophila TaxID=112248 RepID=A0A1M4TM20_9BACL|nr:exodeoxyribonuclease VII small subunit [Seinonella peptonophila]SHE45510.1 Exodeoxyribonuclease VII small subunit [Seinonella peptonophila]
MERQELSFESAMERLEEVVLELEKGDISLEESIRLFNEGMKLAQHCGYKLDWAEQKIEMLIEENNQFVKKPFQPEEDSND